MDISDIINKEIGKTSIVCGLGPSLSNSINWINENKNDIVLISCNEIDIYTELYPNYWVFANSVDTLPRMSDRVSKYPNSIVVHADSVDTTPKKWIEDFFKSNYYVGYDQRHFNGQPCPNCPNHCANLIPNRKTIQEHLRDYCNYDELYSTGDTVAVHMLSLAILLGLKTIYISGIDLDYSKGYYNTNYAHQVSFSPHITNILNDFKIIYNSAKNIGVNIFNTNPNSPLSEIIPTIKL
jgi:hypothetical protein